MQWGRACRVALILRLVAASCLAPCLALNVGTNLSYIIEAGDLGAWTTKVGVDWSFADNAKLSPFVALAIPLSDEDDTYYSGSDNEFVAGSMLSVSF